MTTNQRWNGGTSSFRPDEPIDTSAHEVAEILTDSVARGFVEAHHYSRSYPAARFRFGLYERGTLVGVAVFSHPVRDEVLTNVFPSLPVKSSVELGRFVLLDRVAGNGESWFLARCFEQLRGRIVGVLSFSDPMPRMTADGAIVMPGHVGRIYQASNARYLGRGRADTLRLLPDGRTLNRRTMQKIRDADQGWRYATELLVEYGAAQLATDADEPTRRAWLAEWCGKLTRPVRHRGNHKYAWVIDRRHHNITPASIAGYPKEIDAIAA